MRRGEDRDLVLDLRLERADGEALGERLAHHRIDDADAATARATLGLANVKTDSYVGHIETPADGTYYIDANPVVDKTITELYLKWSNDGSNAGTLALVVDATTVDTVDLSSASNPYTSSALSQAATGGDEIKITLSSVADVSDLRFVVEYTQ